MSWRKIKLESLLSTRPKSLNPAEFPSEVFALYSVPGFDRQQPDIVSGSEIGSAKQILYPGDVLLSKIVPHIRRCWVVGHAPPEHRQIGSGEWIVFRSRLVDSNYLSKVLVADEFYQAFMRTVAGVGGSLLRARPAAVADIEIPLPPLDEQKRIAAVLDKADALRLQREATRQLTEKLLKSVFLDMFGDPAQHSQSGLIDLLKRPLRNGLSPASAGEHRGTVFTLSAITQGFFNSTARKDAMFAAPPKPAARVDEADFLICRGNGNVNLCGQGQFPTDDAVGIIFPDTIIAASIDLTRVSKAYFATLWNQPFVRRQLEGGARTANGTYKVNQATLENIQIPIPDFERQVEFGKVAQSITSRRLEQKASADYSHTLFSSLQQRAFRGELDLSRLVLDSQDDSPLAPEPEKPSTKATKPKPATLVLQAPQTTESAVRKLDDTVSRSEPIPWSADYFKYRILGERSAPFTFGEVMQKAESVFDELPPYEEIKDMILELLGQGGGPAVLRQRFEQVDEKSKEVSGSKEIVFGPAA